MSLDLEATFHDLVDQDEVNYKVVQQLNAIFGKDLKSLRKVSELVEDLTKSKDELEKRLRFATTEAPDKITKAVKAADDALNKEKKIYETIATLQSEVESHKNKQEKIMKDIGPDVRVVVELERVKLYNQYVNSVEELSKDIESSLHLGVEGQALVAYGKLLEKAKFIQESQCKNLVNYVTKTLLYWNRVFTKRFTSEFSSVLKAIKWPFTSSNESVSHPPASPESIQRLCTLTQYLLHLVLPDGIAHKSENDVDAATTSPAIVADFKSPMLPIQLLVRPLEVRFMYHFSGNKATNSRENPEWYFTQVLKWISTHENFLNARIQPVLNDCNYKNISAKVEFIRGLVRLVVLKLSTSLPEAQYDDDTFCSTVQETLNFERELLSYGYPASQPSVLSVLTQASNFTRWINIEKKFAHELMDELLSNDDAWLAVDSGEAAHCGEQLILLLQGITDRYKRLPQPGHRHQFLELQLELLDDFRVRVLQVMRSEKQDPLTSKYPAILNTVHHIMTTLNDWADIPFFVEMQYYSECFNRIQDRTAAAIAGYESSRNNSSFSPDDPSSFSLINQDVSIINSSISPEILARQDAFESLNTDTKAPSISQLAEVSGSVFDATVELYHHIQGEMICTLASFVFSEVRARSQPYRKDKWFHNTNPKHFKDVKKISEPSPSICPLLEVLARHLHALRDVLAPPLFTELWKKIADTLNKYIYEEVILQARFSNIGAAQFKFDMTRGLFPIFGEFTQKPENFFKLVKESVILLNLPYPTTALLRDTIRMWNDDQGSSSLAVSPVKALDDHGVSVLSPQEADTIMNIRIYDQNMNNY